MVRVYDQCLVDRGFAEKDWKKFFVEAEEYATVTVQQSVVAPSELNPANVKVGEKIAEGFFGVMFAGKLLNTDIAIKTFKDTTQNIDMEKEFKLIQ